MATANIEQTINTMERAGWRLQNLSQTPGDKWSCVLERRKLGANGHGVHASSPLCATPGEAVATAWEAAQAKAAIPPVVLPRLKVALCAARAALATSDDADDTF